MRTGLSTIHQTLTPEAANTLNQAITEAARRNHSQTTPLHVASTLLASPSGFLRQACIKSHPNSSHPLQCRALELCFSVALDRLQTSSSSHNNNSNMDFHMEPPVSNALMAALKRAQAHQRRGCPEQQQQPLLAVKVELDQLIVSILDDPSVSRVMREAGFSSPAVKVMVEKSLNFSSCSNSSVCSSFVSSNPIGLGFRPKTAVAPVVRDGRDLYINPRLQLGHQKVDEVKRVIDVLLRVKKKNPILVGEFGLEFVIKEVLRRIENREMQEMNFNEVCVILLEKELPLDKAEIPERLKELGDLIEKKIGDCGFGGVLFNLGDLKWLVDQPLGGGNMLQQAIVGEMAKLVAKFRDSTCGFWLIGTATCETYLRCQVYHPSMEIDWDLQAVPIAAKAPMLQTFPRLGTNGILGVSLESPKGFPVPSMRMVPSQEKVDSAPGSTMCCPECTHSYEKEVAGVLKDIEKASDSIIRSEATRSSSSLPQWLQNARTDNGLQNDTQKVVMMTKTQELQKKWHQACLHLHPKFHQQNLSPMSLYNQNLLVNQSQPKTPECTLQLRPPELSLSPPDSPVTTKLALGQAKLGDHCISESQTQCNKMLDKNNSFKELLEALTRKVWWQKEAASAIATTITQSKTGNGKKRGGLTKGDIWLLFLGPDKASKKKMAETLSQIVSNSTPITFSFKKTDVNVRGKTALDRIAEAVRNNPFSVIVLENIYEADMIIRAKIKQAMQQGRFCDSHSREISLGNIIFILTANEDNAIEEVENNKTSNGRNCQLRLSIAKKARKHRLDQLCNEEKMRKKQNISGLTFDLNEAVESEDGSMNSSDITVEHEESNNVNIQSPTSYSTMFLPREFLTVVDGCLLFKAMEAATIRDGFATAVERRLRGMVEKEVSVEIEEVVLEKIANGVRISKMSVDEWIEKEMVPSLKQLKRVLDAKSDSDDGDGGSVVVRVEER